jgi:hypothetical protein
MKDETYKEIIKAVDYYQQSLHTIIKKQAYGDFLNEEELQLFRKIINE